MRAVIIFLLVLITPILYAQDVEEKERTGFRYTNSFLSGGSVGGSEELWGLSVSTFHGAGIERWRFMAGVGLDGYSDWLTYPLMAGVSFDFIKGKRSSMYVVVNSGYAWANRTREVEWATSYSDNGGMIFNPMIGYRMNLGDVSLYFQSGYKNQKVGYSYSYDYGGWDDYPGNRNVYNIEQNLNRFVFQIGFGF